MDKEQMNADLLASQFLSACNIIFNGLPRKLESYWLPAVNQGLSWQGPPQKN